MQYFRRINQRVKLSWGILFCVALLFAQSATLHVHMLEHDHEHHQHHEQVIDDGHEHHAHMSWVHLSNDTTHDNHHETLGTEVEVTPEVWFKHFSNSVFTIAFIAFILCLILPPLVRSILRPPHLILSESGSLCFFSPPLRAPPCND